MTETLVRTSCPACGADRGHVLSDRDGKTGEPLTVVECGGCGLGHVHPMPTAETLEAWYTHQYRQDYKAAEVPHLRHVLRAARIARARWDWLAARPGFTPPARALDIGASSGEFVYLLGRRGVAARGIEPHAGYSRFARDALGLDVAAGTLQQHLPDLPDGGFELVSMFHVLEHLTDPLGTLRAIARLLAPQGRLFIEVPDAAGTSAPRNTFFRAHTLYFSPHSLRAVAHAAGFEVEADNFASRGNLRVVLRRSPAPAPEAPWAPSDALRQAQQARRWHRYLWERLRDGHAWRRHAARAEEKRTASAFGAPRPLLDAVYAAT
ncbi:class I SAM-dependent methyltransferase [Ramlibacter sp. MAHUQ-53]|uniref:class I SAM-dependent methyltransferase n=1 Tax=unclassified Ramlibacter TaxID=2617605 RepID=UPI003643252A